MKTAISTVITAIVLVGCAASGVQISQESATQFTEGVSTESAIIAKLGKPTMITMNGPVKLITYSGSQYQTKAASFIPVVGLFAGGADMAVKTVSYQINKAGILEKIIYSEYNSNVRTGSQPAPMEAQEPRAVP
jgi:hypothetical protein